MANSEFLKDIADALLSLLLLKTITYKDAFATFADGRLRALERLVAQNSGKKSSIDVLSLALITIRNILSCTKQLFVEEPAVDAGANDAGERTDAKPEKSSLRFSIAAVTEVGDASKGLVGVLTIRDLQPYLPKEIIEYNPASSTDEICTEFRKSASQIDFEQFRDRLYAVFTAKAERVLEDVSTPSDLVVLKSALQAKVAKIEIEDGNWRKVRLCFHETPDDIQLTHGWSLDTCWRIRQINQNMASDNGTAAKGHEGKAGGNRIDIAGGNCTIPSQTRRKDATTRV